MQASGDSRDQRRSAILIEREFDIGSLGPLRHALRELIVDGVTPNEPDLTRDQRRADQRDHARQGHGT
jgi:hypothetical protein